MPNYYIRERHDLNREGETIQTYEVRSEGTVDLGNLAHQVHRKYRAISESELEGIAEDFLREMTNYLASGYSVSLGELGNFGIRIGLREDAPTEESSRRNSRSLCVKGLTFKANKGFIRDVNSKCQLTREGGGVQRLHRSRFNREERIQRAVDFLEKHHVMYLKDYAYLSGLSRTAASQELREFDADPAVPICSKGRGVSKIFVLQQEVKQS